MSNIVQEWLSEYKAKARPTKTQRLNKFLEWFKKSPEEFCKLTHKEAKHILLKFQADMKEAGAKNNSILSYISTAKLLYEYANEVEIKFRNGQLLKAQKAKGYHSFSNGDLKSIFDIANVQYKALIASASSLGWSISDILNLDKERVKNLIKRARENNEEFIFFTDTRKKTEAEALGILNPLAIEWLEKWIEQNEEPTLFTVKVDAINYMLKKLADQSITTTGEIKFHKIRSWTISSLIKAGFSEFEAKYIVGKKIPLSDETYLSLEESIKEKYPKAYYEHLCIVKSETRVAENEIVKLEDRLKKHEETIQKMYKAIKILQKREEMYEEMIKQPEKLLRLKRALESVETEIKG